MVDITCNDKSSSWGEASPATNASDTSNVEAVSVSDQDNAVDPPEFVFDAAANSTVDAAKVLAEYHLVITDENGVKSYKRLYFPQDMLPSEGVYSGWSISVQGRPAIGDGPLPCDNATIPDQDFTVASIASASGILVDYWTPLGGPIDTAGWPPLINEVWDITSVTFILNMCNNPLTVTASQVRSQWFDSDNNDTSSSLEDYYSTCSYNKYTFKPQNNIVVGPINIPCNGVRADGSVWSSTTCSVNDRYGWAEFAEDYAVKVLRLNLSVYRHGIFAFNNPKCPFTGIANAGCGSYCRSWLNSGGPSTVPSINSAFHELGHNYFLHHSQGIDGNEYSDLTGAMGGCCAIRCYNAPHTAQIGWSSPINRGLLNATTLPMNAWQSFVVPSSSMSVTANYISIATKSWGGISTYYLGYKTSNGYDRYLSSTWLRKLNVYTWEGTNMYSMIMSRLVTQLVARGTFTDNINRLRIRVSSTGTSSAGVQICRWSPLTTAAIACP